MPVKIIPKFYERTFSLTNTLDFLELDIVNFEHNCIGGPTFAEIDIMNGDAQTIESALDYLRYYVIFYTEYSLPVWWGYISGVEVWDGPYRAGVEIDSMYNRVAYRYVYKPDGGGASVSEITTYAQDAESIAKYGVREYVGRSNSGTTTQAEADRDKYLEWFKYPQPTSDFTGTGQVGGKMRLKGLWDTFGWMYYQNTGENHESIETQFAAMYAQTNQFCQGIDFVPSASWLSNEFRDGNRMANIEMAEVLSPGSDAGNRLVCWIDPDRYLHVDEADVVTKPYIYTRDGNIKNYRNAIIEKESCPVGVWMKPENSFDFGLADEAESPYPVFVESATYSVKDGKYTPRTIGKPNPFDSLSGGSFR